MKSSKTTHQKIMDITFIGVFAALSYIVLAVLFIPFADMYIHFGNLVVVLAALLIGGWQGGLAGSIGMGFFDLFSGYATSAPKTFLLKFLIGLTAGLVYRFFASRKRFPSVALFISGGISVLLGAAITVYSVTEYHAFTGRSAILAPVFFLIGVLCIVFGLLKKRFSQKNAAAVIGAVCGMAVNIVGETLWKVVTFTLAGSSVQAAFTTAVLGQASTLINAGIAVIGGVALFTALEKPFTKIYNK